MTEEKNREQLQEELKTLKQEKFANEIYDRGKAYADKEKAPIIAWSLWKYVIGVIAAAFLAALVSLVWIK